MRGRFDYTPADCVKFHDAIESEFMPAVRELQAERREKLGLEQRCARGTSAWIR